MMRKKIRVSVDPGPSSSFQDGEEARARFKYQCLFLDYQELLKETTEKKSRLNTAFQRKFKLLDEVKFLSKKYQFLSKNPPVSENLCRLNQQSCKEFTHPLNPIIDTKPPNKKRNLKSKQVSVQSSPKLADLNHFKVPLNPGNLRAKEAYVQSAPKLLDLNQVSLPNEEMGLEVKCDPLKINNLKRKFVEGDVMVDNVKLTLCRDIGSSESGWGTENFHGKISTL